MPVSSCQSVGVGELVEEALKLLKSSGMQHAQDVNAWESLRDESNHNEEKWKLSEVRTFCDGVRRFGDNMRKVWQLLSEFKTFREILDFYLRIYPHAQRGGVARLLDLYRRAEKAADGKWNREI